MRVAMLMLFTVPGVASGLGAQSVLAPTTNTTIPTGGTLHYSSIHVPAGITVTFSGAQPAIVRCDGNALIEGTIAVSGSGNGPTAPGWGSYCYDPLGNGHASSGAGGQHAGAYGSAMPFTLEGGSSGSGVVTYTYSPFPYVPCAVNTGFVQGSPGGGTLVINANGRITVRGSVLADGSAGWLVGSTWSGWAFTGSGSGGSILLAGGQGVEVATSGTVAARGVPGSFSWPPYPSGDGYVRLDSFGAPPVVSGAVAPAPMNVELPHLRAVGAPQLGTTWQLRVHAPPGDAALIALAFASVVAPTPFGLLGIDPAQAVPVDIVVLPNQVVDPTANTSLAIPSWPALAGSFLWLQAVDFVAPGSPRLSNFLGAQIQ